MPETSPLPISHSPVNSDVHPGKLENFRRSFDLSRGSCRATCVCGRTFYDDYNAGYSWEPGEFEKLQGDPAAVALGHSVGFVAIGGDEYVYDCECWHGPAARIIDFLDRHLSCIAKYSELEKARKQAVADRAVVVSV